MKMIISKPVEFNPEGDVGFTVDVESAAVGREKLIIVLKIKAHFMIY